VRIKPGGQSTVGKQAIAAENEKFHAQYPEFKVLKYAPFSTEVQIAALVAGTYPARLEGDNLYVYGETSDGKGKVVHFKIKRGGAAHGTMHPAGNPASN
jgi:hypothetical protein